MRETQLKDPVCPLCRRRDSRFCFSERDYELLSCQFCGLFFINPYPEENIFHNKVSEYSYKTLRIIGSERHYSASKYLYRSYLHRIEQECKDAESILDVGCGTGYLLEHLGNDLNIHRVGIELNSHRAEFAEHVANCEIYQVPLERFEYHQKFDVITMINVLSHIPSFDSLFYALRSLLADNGKLILKVGEMTRDVQKDAVFDWGIPDHLHFLGMNTLYFICEKYGFKTLLHDKQPLSKELFTRSRWNAPGRSIIRNTVKRLVAFTPLALQILAYLYDLRYGRKIYSSFIVLTP